MSSLRLSGSADEVIAAVDGWLSAVSDPGPLVVETSGSTGAPKQVLLSRRAVTASAAATAARLGAQGRWLLALPPTYVAGLMVVVRALVAGSAPVLVGADSLASAVDGPPDVPLFCSLVPTQLVRLLESPHETEALRRLHTVLLGGGPIPAGLRERAAGEGVRVVATYGSAETSGGCVYDGLPLDGVGLAIGDAGRIRLAGPTLFDGYADDPALTASTLVDGWFLTSDAGRVDEVGRLQVRGRLDDVVVSGGVNVPGPAVAARLREHPAVGAVEVLGVDDPEWGQRVVAFVVGELPLDAARDWVAVTLPRAWAPRQVVAVAALPLLATGKLDRVSLRGLA